MAKYEASSARHILRDQHGHHVAFQPGPKRNEAGDQFGEFNTGGKLTPNECGCQGEKELVGFIEGSHAFKSGRVGLRGIWKHADRIAHETSVDHKTARTAVVANMNEAQLRAVISASNVGVPLEGVAIEELQELAVKCLEGTIAPGTVIEPKPPVGPEEPVDTGDAAGDGKVQAKGKADSKGNGKKDPK
jgi:hypothetical protein